MPGPGDDRAACGALVDLLATATTSATVVALWTWLDRHRAVLGSLATTELAFRQVALQRAVDRREIRQVAAEIRDRVRAAAADLALDLPAVVGAAAAGLAELAAVLDQAGWPPATHPVVHETHVVTRRSGWLSGRADPPAAKAMPSVAGLAPNLLVAPTTSGHRSVRLVGRPDDGPARRSWDLLQARWAARVQTAVGDDADPPSAVLADLGSWAGHPMITDDRVEPRCTAIFADPEGVGVDAEGAALMPSIVAAAAGADILLMPELCLSPGMLDALQRALAAQDVGPIITVAGLTHAPVLPAAGQARYVNEAVFLGPDGIELARHRKLTRAQVHDVTEDSRVGDSVTVVPTEAGGISAVICLDLFAQVGASRLLDLPAQLVLVPSLSPSARPHHAAASVVANSLWGVVLVCNRWPAAGPTPEADADVAASFVAVATRAVAVPPEVSPGIRRWTGI